MEIHNELNPRSSSTHERDLADFLIESFRWKYYLKGKLFVFLSNQELWVRVTIQGQEECHYRAMELAISRLEVFRASEDEGFKHHLAHQLESLLVRNVHLQPDDGV